MIEGSLLKSNFIGKDGFIWWIGQVAPAKVWRNELSVMDSANYEETDENSIGGAWAYRCKVRIIGYHPFDRNILPDDDLPWAHVMTTGADGAAQGAVGQTLRLTGGEIAFGFFIDGEEAQQPVLVGCIHRNESVQNFPVEDLKTELKPFTGHVGPLKQAPTQIRAKNKGVQGIPNPKSSPVTGIGESKAKVGNLVNTNRVENLDPGADKLTRRDLASQQFADKTNITVVRENGCNDNLIGKISAILNEFISFIARIQEFKGKYIDPVANVFVDIVQEIKGFARRIVGIIKFIINNMRSAIINLVTKLFRDFIAKVLPLPQQPPVAEATKNIVNIIFCLFEKLLPRILDFIINMLSKMVGNAINAPLCAVEEFTAGILGKLIEMLDDLLAPIMSGLDWLLGGLSQVSSVLSQVSSLAQQILNFIGCDQLKCKPASSWSTKTGPNASYKDSWSRTLDKLNVFRGINSSIDAAMGYSSLFGYSGTPFLSCYNSSVNPSKQSDISSLPVGVIAQNCIPPEVTVSGSGVQASLVPIVADNGSILTVEVINPGKGYLTNPTVNIIDNTNHGSGAELGVTIENGRISSVYVINPGSGYCKSNYSSVIYPPTYLITANKYTIFEGDTVEFNIKTTNVTNGTKLTYELTGDVEINDIDLNSLNGEIEINNNSANLSVTAIQDDTPEAVETIRFNLFDSDGSNVATAIVLVNDKSAPVLSPEPNEPSESPPGVPIPNEDDGGTTEGNIFNPEPPFTPTFPDGESISTTPPTIDTPVIPGLPGDAGTVPGGDTGTGIGDGDGGTGTPDDGTGGDAGTVPGGDTGTGIGDGDGGTGTPDDGTGIGTDSNGNPNPFNPPEVTNPGIGTNIVGIVTNIVPINPGFGYTEGDKIVVGPCEYTPILTPNGSIVGVTSLSCSTLFSSNPSLDIISSTGQGALLYPILKYVPQYNKVRTINQVGVVSYVDCV